MASLTMREAIAMGLQEALDNDPRVFIMGEDVGIYGGAYAVTKGFHAKYGGTRIKDTPISEAGFVGAGVGAAMGGLLPVVEIMTINFSLLASDQIINHAAKIHYMSNGQYSVPMIIRTVTGGGAGLGPTHSQSFEGWYATIPGLKVVIPSTPFDALGLLRSCFEENNPVLYCEHALLYNSRGEVPDKFYKVPLGISQVRREGTDLTIATYGRMTQVALEVAEALAGDGVETEVIDLRSLSPLDSGSVVQSTLKSHRCMVLEEVWSTGAIGAYLAHIVQEAAFDSLDAPVIHMGGADVPTPYAKNLELLTIPDKSSVIKRLRDSFAL